MKVKIGLLGAGHLGKIHLRLLKEIDAIELIGFYDPDVEVRKKVAEEYKVDAFDDMEALIEQVDAIDIVTPTVSHFECADLALKAGKHIFIEKPLTRTLNEAERLIEQVEAQGLVAQVGHVERFNPAFLAVSDRELHPMFIEGHRLARYNPRGTDVPVVLDLMIHDLDVLLSLVKSPVRSVSASGVSVISSTPDIANARIEFENGCVANLTASRISIKNMRRLRMFQKNNYLVVDFLEKKAEVFRISEDPEEQGMLKVEMDSGDEKKYLIYELPPVEEVNAIQMELEEFAHSIREGSPVRVSIQDGFRALKLAHTINEEIERHLQRIEP